MLPTGAVVFLFTDVEGSTVRWDAHRDAMQEAIRRHDALMRDAIETHAGIVFKTMGDAFYAVFERVQPALEAALDAQRRIAREDWSAVRGLRVRMAVHAGEAEQRDGDYFGPALNRTARLLAAGHGGQVLVSSVAAQSANERAPDGASLRRLGAFALKDIATPETVYQLYAADLQTHFKPLRTLDAVPNNLPRSTTSFIGREEDLARIGDLLERSPLVTIAGTGGVGKTRLAVQAATAALPEMRDGAWFVNLAPIEDPALVPSTVLSALGVEQNADRPPIDVLVEHLRDLQLQIVLDNCEQIVNEAAALSHAIVERCPQISIIATSREALNVPGELVYRLPSLAEDDAIRLFLDRARAAKPNFRATDADRRTIAEICKRLDGIALAIELAASRVAMLALDELLKRLNERFRLLTGGSRAELPRHQTMRALIDWSYGLLDEGEKRFFRRTSAFAGSFSLEAARAICAGDPADEWEALERLTSLVNKSLVVAEDDRGRRRFRLLESIYEYARESIAGAGELNELVRSHAAYFADVAREAYEAFDRAPDPDWLERLRADIDNFRSALHATLDEGADSQKGAQLAADLVPAFMRLSLLREGIQWCEAAQEACVSCEAIVQARLYYGLSMLQNNQGAHRDAFASIQRAVERFRETGDERGLARAIAQLAQQYARQERYDEAIVTARDALDRARRIGDKRLLASSLQRCASVFPPDRIEEARAQFSESVEIFRELGRSDETARALLWWAQAEGEAGDLRRALDVGLEALPIASTEVRFYATTDVAGYALALEEYELGVPTAREAFEYARDMRHPIAVPITIGYLAAMPDNDPAQAARLAGYAAARLAAMEWAPSPDDAIVRERLLARLRATLPASQLDALLAEGAAWNEERALDEASRVR